MCKLLECSMRLAALDLICFTWQLHTFTAAAITHVHGIHFFFLATCKLRQVDMVKCSEASSRGRRKKPVSEAGFGCVWLAGRLALFWRKRLLFGVFIEVLKATRETILWFEPGLLQLRHRREVSQTVLEWKLWKIWLPAAWHAGIVLWTPGKEACSMPGLWASLLQHTWAALLYYDGRVFHDSCCWLISYFLRTSMLGT